MVEVFISIGSNINPKQHIPSCLKKLENHFGEIRLSKCYESEAVGFKGDNFLNLVVSIQTDIALGEVNQFLHDLEKTEGRKRTHSKAWNSRTLDLDILLYGDESGVIEGIELPRPEILDHAHVLMPLVELAGNQSHPMENKTYAELLLSADFEGQDIWEVSLSM